MSVLQSKAAALLEKWFVSAREHFYTPADNPEIMCYGTGESYHWAVQTNTNTFGALAALAMSPELNEKNIGMSREELQQTALKILRYTLRTHKSAGLTCSNGLGWGKSWISGLSLERMRPGIDCMYSLFTDRDKAELRSVMLAEGDFLLDDYEIKAGMGFYENRPESNTWNGAVLLRCATDYPDAPRREEYLTKARQFFINAISIPSDAGCTDVFGGKMVKDLFIGPNFTPVYSLNHNGYQNMGYAALTLSNVGFLHFSFKKRGIELPPEVYRHSYELWQVLKNFFYPDGRLFRPGGDGRARYCYCQDYAMPAWLFAMDRFGDPIAAQYESRWVDIVSHEAELNPDGAFLSGRLAEMKKVSPFYYTRLEGDRAVTMSYGLCWRDAGLLADQDYDGSITELPEFNWGDDTHMTAVHKNQWRAAAMTWDACAKPIALFTPADRSDMVEWHRNLTGEMITSNISDAQVVKFSRQHFDGGFVNSGAVDFTEKKPFGEGELESVYARHAVAYAALPDGKSALIMQHGTASRRIYLRRIQGCGYKMPNDIFNGKTRTYTGEDGKTVVLTGCPDREEIVKIDSPVLTVDGALTLYNVYGGSGFTIYRPAKRQIPIDEFPHTTIYADEICTRFEQADRFAAPGELVIDCGVCLSVDRGAVRSVKQLAVSGSWRAVEASCAGGSYVFLANFSDEEAEIPAEFRDLTFVNFVEKPAVLGGYQAVLLKR